MTSPPNAEHPTPRQTNLGYLLLDLLARSDDGLLAMDMARWAKPLLGSSRGGVYAVLERFIQSALIEKVAPTTPDGSRGRPAGVYRITEEGRKEWSSEAEARRALAVTLELDQEAPY